MDNQQNFAFAFGLFVLGLVIGGAGGYWAAGLEPWEATQQASTAPQGNPLAEVESNPLEGVKTNPFE